jgi:hypothetical protein
VAGEQSRYVRRWLIPHGALTKINPHKQHELLKQIRLLVVAYDNMDEASKDKLTTAAEVLANLDVLIEVGQVCLAAEHARRLGAPRPLRPTQYGAHDVPIVIDGSLVPMSSSPQPIPHSNGSSSSSSSNGHANSNNEGVVKYHYPPAQEYHVGGQSPQQAPSHTVSNVSHDHFNNGSHTNKDVHSTEIFKDDAAYNTPPRTRHAQPAQQQQQQPQQQQQQAPQPPHVDHHHHHHHQDAAPQDYQYYNQVQSQSPPTSSNGSIPSTDNQSEPFSKPKFKSTASKVQQKLEERVIIKTNENHTLTAYVLPSKRFSSSHDISGLPIF